MVRRGRATELACADEGIRGNGAVNPISSPGQAHSRKALWLCSAEHCHAGESSTGEGAERASASSVFGRVHRLAHSLTALTRHKLAS